MTLVFMDSYDHYTTLQQKYSAIGGTVSIGAGGRNSTRGCIYAAATATITKVVAANSTFICGAAVYIASRDGVDRPIFGYEYDTTKQCGLYIKATTGELVVKRGDSAVVLETSTEQLGIGTYPYIEFKATISNTGSWEVRVNGDVWCQGTGDTQNHASIALGNVIRFGAGNAAGIMDDVYVLNGDGSYNNDFLGDVRVEAILPDGAGNYTQWTVSSGINWQAVAEVPPDSDTTYNYSSVSGNIDTFTFGNLTTVSGTIYGIQNHLFARKDDAAIRKVQDFYRRGGVDYPGSGVYNLSTTYAYYIQTYELDPATDDPWTIANINDAEFGYKNVS